MSKLSSIVLSMAVLASACAQESGDVCQQAIDVVEQCTGVAPDYPAEGCVASFEDEAEAVIEGGCDALDKNGKSDQLCEFFSFSFINFCSSISLEEAAKLSRLDEVCPADRGDDLCSFLHEGDFEQARDATRSMMANTDDGAIDPALAYYLRERIISLVVWNKLTEDGTKSPPLDYRDAAGEVLDEHYPAYADDPTHFAMARMPTPPIDGTDCVSNDVVVYFPGVVRGATGEGYENQLDGVIKAFPCLWAERIDTENFIHPTVNAEVAREQLARYSDSSTSFHFIGYSQGSSNALQTLVDAPEIAERTRTSFHMNSAARGSEVGDALYGALRGREGCGGLPEAFQPTCESVGGKLLALVERISASMAIPLDLQGNLHGHIEGIYSLTTEETGMFWQTRGSELPRHIFYTSFRSVITDEDQNLPRSNRLSFSLLERAGDLIPYNDMQVLLSNMTLGGPIADREIELAVAEGNHWQWELNTRDISEDNMPADMSERTPQVSLALAYFQTLYELGAFR